MPLTINIRHLEEKDLLLRGELGVEELELEGWDELIHARQPLLYNLRAQMVGQAILVQGTLALDLECECARCLQPFQHKIRLDCWAAHLPLQGPEKAALQDDLADLTPSIREDILLEFPRHPLCGIDCGGLPNRAKESKAKTAGSTQDSSAWSELNKLKF
jgi:uncharacterized metal-binding protein YceD (DUF177 family)